MRTPAGKECGHYYEDYNRGRNIQECRRIKANRNSLPWKPGDCAKCQVPEILYANASPNLELEVTVKPRFIGFGRLVEVKAFCKGEEIPVERAYTGCTEERPGLDVFRQALENSDDD